MPKTMTAEESSPRRKNTEMALWDLPLCIWSRDMLKEIEGCGLVVVVFTDISQKQCIPGDGTDRCKWTTNRSEGVH